MENSLYKIEPKDVYSRLKGTVKGSATSVIIRVLPYVLFSPTINTYIEFFDSNSVGLFSGYNKTFPTPSDWGTDDSVVINSIALALNVKIIPEPVPVTEPTTSSEQSTTT